MKTIYGHQATGSCGLTEEARKCALQSANMSSRFAKFILRFAAVLLLMLVVGVGGVKGQDYSGIYYIANDNSGGANSGSTETTPYSDATDAIRWFLVPADNPQQQPNNNNASFTDYRDTYYSPDLANTGGDSEKPYLTTYQTNKDAATVPSGVTERTNNSVWIVKKTSDGYYYVIHAATGKYVIYEVPLPNQSNNQRKTMHLQTPDDEKGTGTYRLSTNDNFKFIITRSGTTDNYIYYFQPKNRSGWYWNPAGGNRDSYSGIEIKDNIYYGGLVGIYNKDSDGGSKWRFVDAAFPEPIINVESGTFTITTDDLPTGCSIRFTTGDGSQDAPTPTTEGGYTGTPYTGAVEISNFTNVKAVVVGHGMVLSRVSNAMLDQRITLSPSSYEYNGQERKPAVTINYGTTGEIPAEEFNVTYENNTNAGTATVTITNKAGGSYYVITATEEFTINPASVTLTANSGTETYDGSEKTVTGFVCNVNGLNFPGVSASASGTNAGEYDVMFNGVVINETKDVTGNYIVTSTTNGTLTINPASITLTANSRNTDVYNGTEKTVTGFTCKKGEQTVEGLIFTGVTASGKGTNAGTYDVIFTGVTVNTTKDDTGNYVVTGTTNGTLTINRKEVTITAKSKSKTYDGTALTESGFEATALETGDTHSFTVVMTDGSTITNAGTQPNVIATVDGVAVTTGTATDVGNYKVTTADGTLTISKKDVTISGITAENKVYDGNTTATLVYTDVTFAGKLADDNLTVTATGAFADKTVGTGKTVTISDLTLGGSGVGNYALAESDQQETTTADITVKEVTANGTISATNKEYDGTTTAVLDYTGVTLTGKVDGDDLTVSATGTFADKNVGTGKNVTISGLTLGGSDASNYVLAATGQQTTATANITAKEITVSGINAENKEYDGNTTATLVYTGVTFTDMVEGDNLTITATGLFDNKNVGTDKTVTISGLALEGSDAGNYALAATGQQTTATADITAKDITASCTITASNKVYDGNTSATLDISDVTLTGVVDGDDIAFTATGTFADKNVGTGKTVTIGLALSGNDAGNYNLTSPSIPTSTTADITVKEVTANGTISATNKEYDGTTTAVLDYTGVTLTGKVDGDDLTVSATGTFADKNVGTGKTVNISEWVLAGTDKDNYIMASSGQQTTATANITAKEITVSGINAENKEYDGNTTATLVYTGVTFTDMVEGDNLTITATGLFDNKNVGTDKTVTISGLALDGTDKDNYQLATTGQQESTTANITAAEITVSGITANDKVYDGTTDAELVYTGATLTGKVEGETLTVTAIGTFDNKNVGTDKTVTISDLALDGTDKDNYQLATSGQQETTTANITPATATVTADDKTKGFGDADPIFTATVTGLKNGDDESVLTFTFSRAEGEDVGDYTITPSGDAEQGNYNVTYATGTLTITAKDIGDGENPAEGIDIDITYDGTNYTVTVKQGDNTIATTNYTCSGAYDQDHQENYVITVTGQGNYKNSAKATYTKVTFYDTTPDDATKETTAAVYCATQNLKVNESFEAYYVTSVANNALTLTKVEAGESKKNYIVANQPMILISDAATVPKGFTVKPYTDTEEVTIPDTGEGSNLLKVVTYAGGLAVNLAQVYMFSQGEFVLTKAGTMPKGKFYLENPNYNTPAPSRSSLRIVNDDTTGIATSPHIDTDSEIIDTWYTIGGQKLNKKPTRKGLYLQNGKKVVIK